jgi:hypothetical protein
MGCPNPRYFVEIPAFSGRRLALKYSVSGCMILTVAVEASMGGAGSGSERSTHIGNVEGMLALDIRALRRLGVVAPGECMIDTLCWSIDGLNVSKVRLRLDLSDIERGGIMTIVGEMQEGAIRQNIAIDAMPSPFGGWRCYFLCPITTVRCEILYYNGGRFASRNAHHLAYATQSMNDLSRIRRKVAKLRGRLAGTINLPRPRGRNRIEMVARLQSAEAEAKTLYHEQLSRIVERSASRRIPRQQR